MAAVAVIDISDFFVTGVTSIFGYVSSLVFGPSTYSAIDNNAVTAPILQTPSHTVIPEMNNQNSDQLPNFVNTSLRQAVRTSIESNRLLFIFLYSNNDSNSRIWNTLSNSVVVEFIDQNFLCWGSQMEQFSNSRLIGALQINRFPYIGVCRANNVSLSVLWKNEGMITPDALMMQLSNTYERSQNHNSISIQESNAITTRPQQTEETQLRQLQDLEYEQLLLEAECQSPKTPVLPKFESNPKENNN
eukprot:UN24251